MPELEIWLCPVHQSLDDAGKLVPLDNCVACLRVERDELRLLIEHGIVGWDQNDLAIAQALCEEWAKGQAASNGVAPEKTDA